jgi:hypothetical protein
MSPMPQPGDPYEAFVAEVNQCNAWNLAQQLDLARENAIQSEEAARLEMART